MKLLMISGDRALAQGKRGAFYNTLEEFHKYWERVDIVVPNVKCQMSTFVPSSGRGNVKCLFGNVFIHPSPWPLIFQPFWIIREGLRILKNGQWLMTVHEYPPFYNGTGARILHYFTKIPYMLEIFHVVGYPKAANTKELIYKILYKLFLRFDASKAKAVRVMNQQQVPVFLKRCGVPENKIAYIPAVYIDLDIFKPMNLAKTYDLIFIGRLEKNKGIELLLEAITKLKFQIPNVKCLIVGEGSLKEYLKFEIRHLDLQDNVLLHGWAKDAEEVATLLNQSKLLAMPSYNEGGPRVVLEAMACGVPVLATSVGIVPDVVEDKKSGLIIDWNAEDIAKKTRELLSDTEQYNKYKQNGLEIVKQFEKKTAIKNYAEALIKYIS